MTLQNTLEDNSYDSITKCPSCGEPIPVHNGFTTWCHKCNWNVNTNKHFESHNPFMQLYCKLSRKYTIALSKEMNSASCLKPRFSFSMLLAHFISLIVHIITLLLIILSATIIIEGWPYFLIVSAGIILFIVSLFLIPKPQKFNNKNSCKDNFNELFSLINDIAKSLNAPLVDELIITNEFNAYYFQYGIKQKRVIGIGLPLFNILNNEEKIALIAHELSHGLNEDIQRDYFIQATLHTLEHWYYFIVPHSIIDTNSGIAIIVMIPFNILLLGLSKAIFGLYYIMQSFSWYNSQKAEYLADYYASTACGTDAMISMLNKLCFHDILYQTISLHVSNHLETSLKY